MKEAIILLLKKIYYSIIGLYFGLAMFEPVIMVFNRESEAWYDSLLTTFILVISLLAFYTIANNLKDPLNKFR